MKKYLAILLVGILAFSSCDEEPVVFDSNGGQTLVNFASGSANLEIVIDATGSVDVPINVSTMSDTDRSFTVNIVADGTTADPNSYSFNPTVVIPAGSFNGTLTIMGTDVNVETDAETLELAFDTSSGIVSDNNLVVSVVQVCPIPAASFTGMYRITVVTPGVFGASTYGTADVELTIGDSPTQRVFDGFYFEDSRFSRTFMLNFVCNEIVTPFQDHAVGCGGNDVNLNTGPATTNGIYDPANDASFTVNVTDNVDSDCGGNPVQASYTFTKL